MKLDMHFHSVLSDGRKTSGEILRLAREKGLEFVSFTDHDVVFTNADVASKVAFDIESCEGAEVSAFDSKNNKHLHLTAYARGFNMRVHSILRNVRDGRHSKIEKQIEILKTNGFEVSREGFYKFYHTNQVHDDLASSINNFHLAWYVLDSEFNRKIVSNLIGFDIDVWGFMEYFLKREGVHSNLGSVEVPQYEVDVSEIGNAMEDVGGILSLAHPNYSLTQEEFKSRIEYYLNLGINAVEVNNGCDESWVKLIKEYQEKYDYILTFGSDCHFNGTDEQINSEFGFQNEFVTPEEIKKNYERFIDVIGSQKDNDLYSKERYESLLNSHREFRRKSEEISAKL